MTHSVSYLFVFHSNLFLAVYNLKVYFKSQNQLQCYSSVLQMCLASFLSDLRIRMAPNKETKRCYQATSPHVTLHHCSYTLLYDMSRSKYLPKASSLQHLSCDIFKCRRQLLLVTILLLDTPFCLDRCYCLGMKWIFTSEKLQVTALSLLSPQKRNNSTQNRDHHPRQ